MLTTEPMEEMQGPNDVSQEHFLFERQQVLVNTRDPSQGGSTRRTQISAAESSQNQYPFNARILEGNIDRPRLGLRLDIEALMESINERFNVSEGAKESPSEPRKSPVAHVAASSLTIGEFKVPNEIYSDLVAKFYNEWRKFAWEILDKNTKLKYKIEVRWDNVLAMRAHIERNMPGYLAIKLKKEPQFYRETDPRPRCRTEWKKTGDFTGGPGSKCWIHYLEFPVGVLNKPYERMIQSDSRLFRLSQQPFPSSDSPFSHSDRLHNVPIRHSHHNPAAVVISTQRVGQSYPAYSSPPTYGNVSMFNYSLPQGPNMPLESVGHDGHVNNMQSYSMPGVATGGESSFSDWENSLISTQQAGQSCSAYSNPSTYGNVNVINYPLPQGPNMPLASEGLDDHANNLSAFVDWLMEVDIGMDMELLRALMDDSTPMETDVAHNNVHTSTQNNYFPSTMMGSMDAATQNHSS